MTVQCKRVLEETDFPESDVREIELLLLKHSPTQLINFIWRKDPDGIHDLEWFRPFFKGYLRRINFIDMPEPDDLFWQAYDYLSQALEEITSWDMPAIYEMGRDIKRMKMAIGKSNVHTIPYIRKVFSGINPSKVLEYTRVEFEIGNTGVKTYDII